MILFHSIPFLVRETRPALTDDHQSIWLQDYVEGNQVMARRKIEKGWSDAMVAMVLWFDHWREGLDQCWWVSIDAVSNANIIWFWRGREGETGEEMKFWGNCVCPLMLLFCCPWGYEGLDQSWRAATDASGIKNIHTWGRIKEGENKENCYNC